MTRGAQEFWAGDDVTLEGIVAALGDSFSLGRVGRYQRELTFYDTFDGLLAKAGSELALAEGEPIPESAIRTAGIRALLPLARVRIEAETFALLDDLDKTVVRGELLAPVGLRPRLVLHGLRGYEQELERAAELLGLSGAPESLREEAILAAGGRPEGVSVKVRVALAPGEPADAAVARVLEALWAVIEANLPGTLEDIDSEFLHDYRICVRKTRAVLRELKGVFSRPELEHWRAEFKWLQQVTSATRDLDVYEEDFGELTGLLGGADADALGPLAEALGQRRIAARAEMERQLTSERAQALARGWAGFTAGLTSAPTIDRPDALVPIRTLSGARIAKVYRRMVRQGAAIDAASPAEDYHELRKLGKELRYLLELFGQPLHDAEVVKSMVRALKDLQDVLGRHQDREVQAATVRGLAEDVAARPGGPDALIAIGALIAALGADERAARAQFAEAFAAFSSRRQRDLVRTTFG